MAGFSRNASPSLEIDVVEDIVTEVKNNGTGWANGKLWDFHKMEKKNHVPNSFLISVVQNKMFLLSLFL